MKLNQKGAGAIVALLAVIALTLVGGAGYYVFNSQKKTADQVTSTAEKPATTPETKSSVPEQKYLEVKEWGMKVLLTDDLTDLQYASFRDGIKFYTKKYKDLGGVCDSNYSIVTYVRGQGSDIAVTGDGPTPDNVPANSFAGRMNAGDATVFQVGDYYYATKAGGGSCDTPESTALVAERDKKPKIDAQMRAMQQL